MQSKGRYRVRFEPTPNADLDMIQKIKTLTAEMIDLIDKIPSDRETIRGNEAGRLKALAQTEIESASHWAVKAASTPEPSGR